MIPYLMAGTVSGIAMFVLFFSMVDRPNYVAQAFGIAAIWTAMFCGSAALAIAIGL
jgi:uncharacterized membrane protein